jgi:hypothetical protein
MPRVKERKRRAQVAAVLVAHGAPAPATRPRWASYGAGVSVPGVVPVGVEVVTEAQARARPRKKTVSLTRFAPGTRIPGQYKVVAELATEE